MSIGWVVGWSVCYLVARIVAWVLGKVENTGQSSMRIGFTGTRRGMTEAQRTVLKTILAELRATEFHHGDCVGADAEAHDIAVSVGCEVVIHPPVVDAKRAWKRSERMRQPRSYLVRNKDIVRDSEILVAAPGEDTEQIRSGTWSTVRFAASTAARCA